MATGAKSVTGPARPIPKQLSLRSLLRPHLGALTLGFIAIAGESAANLLQPWPLKVVLDDVLRSHQSHASLSLVRGLHFRLSRR